jgi:hypothetical protein
MSPTGNQRKGDTQLIFVGHDWLEDDHDVAVMNEAAGLIRSARLSEAWPALQCYTPGQQIDRRPCRGGDLHRD